MGVVSVTPQPRFAPGKGPPVPIVQEAGWASESVWTQRLQEKSFCLCRGSNLDPPDVQSVVRHYTDWATPAPNLTNRRCKTTDKTSWKWGWASERLEDYRGFARWKYALRISLDVTASCPLMFDDTRLILNIHITPRSIILFHEQLIVPQLAKKLRASSKTTRCIIMFTRNRQWSSYSKSI
jgi:hypothetical protein